MQIHVNASVLLLTHQVPVQIRACATIAARSPLGHPQNDIAVAVAWRRQAQSKTAKRVRLDDDRMTTASALPATASPQRATAADSLNASMKLRHHINLIQTFTIFKLNCLTRPLPPELKSCPRIKDAASEGHQRKCVGVLNVVNSLNMIR